MVRIYEPWQRLALNLWAADGLAAILAGSADALVVLDRDGVIRFANPAAQDLLGFAPGSLLATSSLDLVHPEDQPATAAVLAQLFAGEPTAATRLRARSAHGGWRTIEAVATNLLDEPAVEGLILNLRDLSSLEATEAALLTSEERFRHLADSAPDFVFRYRVGSDGGFEYASQAALVITGHPAAAFEQQPELIHQLVAADVWESLNGLDWDEASQRPLEFEIRRADGTTAWVQLRVTLHRSISGRVLAVDGILRDLSERRATEVDLLHRALHDPLTGLPNRGLFYERLEHALRRADRLPGSPAVLFLDLDGFKAINDQHGHAAGDDLLIEVSRRLAERVRPGDTIARLGGDEFLVLCDDVTDDAALEAICDRLRDSVTAPCRIGGSDVTVAVSVGAARATPGCSPDEVVRRADEAMYDDKHAGPRTPPSAHRQPEPNDLAVRDRRWNDRSDL